MRRYTNVWYPVLLSLVLAATAWAPTDPTLVLRIREVTLLDATPQPANGLWNQVTNEIQIGPEGQPIVFLILCGPAAAVTFPTRPGLLYECQATDDGGATWLGSAMKVVGTGVAATIYDYPHPHRLYRVYAF